MKKQIDENVVVQTSPTKNIEAFQEKSALETLMSLIAEGKINIPGIDDNVSFLQKLQTEIHTPAKNIELENQLKQIANYKQEIEFSAKKTEIEKKQLEAQKDAFLKRIDGFKKDNEKTKADLEEQRVELEEKGKILLQAQDEIAIKEKTLADKEKLILENSDINDKLESLAALKEDLRLESLKKLEEMREFQETKDQIKSELDDRTMILEARERELEEKEMSVQLVNRVDAEVQSEPPLSWKENFTNIYSQNFINTHSFINSKWLELQQVINETIKKDTYSTYVTSVQKLPLVWKEFQNGFNCLESVFTRANELEKFLGSIYEKEIKVETQLDFIEKQKLILSDFEKKIEQNKKSIQEQEQKLFDLNSLKQVTEYTTENQKKETKKELEKYNAEIDTKVLELVAVKQVQDGDVILDRYKQIKDAQDHVDRINAEITQKYNMIVPREKNIINLKNQIYKNHEYIQKSDATTQAFDPEFEARAKNAMNTVYEKNMESQFLKEGITYRQKELGELIKERALYEYHGEVVDEATQYESTDNEIMNMLKTLAQINENSENPLSKEDFYNRIDDMESKLIMSQLSAEYLDKSIVKKSHKLAALDQAFSSRKYLDEHKTVEKLRVEVVKDLMTKKIAPKFDAFLLREQNIGLDMQKSLFDTADQNIAQYHDQSDNQMNLLGQEVHDNF